jgi:hypothetical protein
MQNNEIKRQNVLTFLFLPKSILQIFKLRPPFILKKNNKDISEIFSKEFLKIINSKIFYYKSSFSSKKFAKSFPSYIKNLKKKNLDIRARKILPFFKNNLRINFGSKVWIKKKFYDNFKEKFPIYFSKFFIINENIKSEIFSNHLKVNMDFNFTLIKNLLNLFIKF